MQIKQLYSYVNDMHIIPSYDSSAVVTHPSPGRVSCTFLYHPRSNLRAILKRLALSPNLSDLISCLFTLHTILPCIV